MAVVVASFTARFNRRCADCSTRVKSGRPVYRLDDGAIICGRCAHRYRHIGL